MSKVRSGGDDRVAVGAPDRRDGRARAEQARIEKIRALAARLELEAAELQHAHPHAQVDELALIGQGHRAAVSQGKWPRRKRSASVDA